MIESKKKKCYTVFMNKMLNFLKELNLHKEIQEMPIFFVGGATRSIIENNNLPKDIDICGNINVEELSHLDFANKQYIKKLHSLRFTTKDRDVDITAFRKEEYKKGYFPSKVERVETAFEDSFRRDFTINAIYIGKDGEVCDFHNGVLHIKEKSIVQITDKTLNIDGMRIYRMLRFALTLGYKIEKNTLECALANKANILQIKRERGKVEFDKFKAYINSENIEIIKALGILEHQEIASCSFNI